MTFQLFKLDMGYSVRCICNVNKITCTGTIFFQTFGAILIVRKLTIVLSMSFDLNAID